MTTTEIYGILYTSKKGVQNNMLKKATFEEMQKIYTNQCNLYWFELIDYIRDNNIKTMNFEQLYNLEHENVKIATRKAVMNNIWWIAHLEGKNLDIEPHGKFVEEFSKKFYNEIYTR